MICILENVWPPFHWLMMIDGYCAHIPHRKRDNFHVQYMIANKQPHAVLFAAPISLCCSGFLGTDCCRRRLARAFEQPLAMRTP